MLLTKDGSIEVSAFTIIVWHTYRSSHGLRLMALIRTIVIQASVWFIAIIITQIYVQVSFHYMEVWTFVRKMA